jgi:hypothetical protein
LEKVFHESTFRVALRPFSENLGEARRCCYYIGVVDEAEGAVACCDVNFTVLADFFDYASVVAF